MSRAPRLAIAAVVLAGLAFLLWKAFLQPRPADADVLSGYVEGEALYLSSPLPGAVTSLSVARASTLNRGALAATRWPRATDREVTAPGRGEDR